MHSSVWAKVARDCGLCNPSGQARRLAPRNMQCAIGAKPRQDLHNSISQGRGLEIPNCTVHVVKCEIWARRPRSAHGECEKKSYINDDVMLSAYLTKC